MNKLSAAEIRNRWLSFFESKEHYILPPSSLIPIDDPSLLWINSGVATLKPYFDGRKLPPSTKIVNSQRSIRTNDIENVGYTARHHTLFEMLGNFSIGDYFKKEAIIYAWEFLTSEQYLGLDKNKLYITVYSEDKETYKLWTETIGVSSSNIIIGGKDTNFWDIGEGPCGPNTEIFYDRGEKYDFKNQGVKLLQEDLENDRYLEIWNIVFSEFNHMPDNTYQPLPRKNIDTGAGLERIASILQETETNFETDLFLPIIKETEKYTSNKFYYDPQAIFSNDSSQLAINVAFKVIADHIRAVTFAIADGVFPSNKDRGYVIRRLIRRAALFGKKIGINDQFLFKLVNVVVEIMMPFYHYLIAKKELISQTVYEEETKFLSTLEQGMKFFQELNHKYHYISKENALKLFESYGFPIELVIEEAKNHQILVDIDGFYEMLEKVKNLSRQQRGLIKAMKLQNEIYTNLKVNSKFIGYEQEKSDNSQIVMIIKDDQIVNELVDESGIIILDKTPFYAEKGGQAADQGVVFNNLFYAYVTDVQQGPNSQHLHQVNVQGKLSINDYVTAEIDSDRRYYTKKNHSGTHILHAALRAVLGNHVMQIGSYNDNEKLRIDISHNSLITQQQLLDIDSWINNVIMSDIKSDIFYCSLSVALKKHHALAFFSEKYSEEVRVVRFGEFSCELCGGTHVCSTKEIEELLITGIESKGSGVFRINALTSYQTITQYLNNYFSNVKQELSEFFGYYSNHNNNITNVELLQLWKNINELEITKHNLPKLKELVDKFSQQYKIWKKNYDNFLIKDFVKKYNSLPILNLSSQKKAVIYHFSSITSINFLKALADDYRNKYQDLIIFFIVNNLHQWQFLISVSKSLEKIISARELLDKISKVVSIKGGGNLGLVQGSFISSETPEKVLNQFKEIIINE